MKTLSRTVGEGEMLDGNIEKLFRTETASILLHELKGNVLIPIFIIA